MSITGVAHRELISASFKDVQRSKTHELPVWPVSPGSLGSREYPVSPVSNGQCLDKELEKELKTLATRNACTCAEDRAETKRFKLARDLCGVQKKIGRKLTTTDVRVASDEWERISLPFLDWNGDDHFAMLVAEVTKVQVPTGEGDTF